MGVCLKLLPLQDFIIDGLLQKYPPKEWYFPKKSNPNPSNPETENNPQTQSNPQNQEYNDNVGGSKDVYYDPAYQSIQTVNQPTIDLPEIPEPPQYITVNIDELAQFLKAIEQMKLPELRSNLAQYYLKHEQMRRWVDTVRNLYDTARKSGITKLLIPCPPITNITTSEDPTMKEFLKVLAPIIALKELGRGEEVKNPSITEIVNAVREIKNMSEGEVKKKIKLNLGDFGEVEVEPEFALLYYTMLGHSNQGEYVVIEKPDGSKEHIPKDLYILQLVKDVVKKEEKKEKEGEEGEGITGKLLKTIESLSNTISSLSKRLDELEAKIKDKGLRGLLDDVNTLLELKTKLNELFGDGSKSDKYERLVALLAGQTPVKENEEKTDKIDMMMQKSRQMSEQMLKPKSVDEVKEKKEEKEND